MDDRTKEYMARNKKNFTRGWKDTETKPEKSESVLSDVSFESKRKAAVKKGKKWIKGI